MGSYKLILIGSFPPPVGGVTIHVKRLKECLEKSGLSCLFIDIRKEGIKNVLKSIFKGKIIHIHTSNVYMKFFFSIFCRLVNKKLLLTYHGNINRYGKLKNFVDRSSVRIVNVPIVLNQSSYNIAKQINRKTVLIPAFIPPAEIVDLDEDTENKVKQLKSVCDTVFCTNAYNVSYDKEGGEIYQITSLITLFNKHPDKGLIVSDPSGMYIKFVKENGIHYADNILFLSFIHDFNAVIRDTDCMIRFTTTDGDSLSVKEALFAGKPVIATNVVERPLSVITIGNSTDELESAVDAFKRHTVSAFTENGFGDLYQLYTKN
jgi:glycosyltransferase involved in cell wall biosynthesis